MRILYICNKQLDIAYVSHYIKQNVIISFLSGRETEDDHRPERLYKPGRPDHTPKTMFIPVSSLLITHLRRFFARASS